VRSTGHASVAPCSSPVEGNAMYEMTWLAPGTGLTDGTISFGDLMTTWLLVQLVCLILIGGALMLFPPRKRRPSLPAPRASGAGAASTGAAAMRPVRSRRRACATTAALLALMTMAMR
jgi:hypothetical protein